MVIDRGTTKYEIFKFDYNRLRIDINYVAFIKVADDFVFLNLKSPTPIAMLATDVEEQKCL